MPHVSRRAFIKSLAAMPLALGFLPRARAASDYIRYDCTSPGGQEMLAVYALAVKQMRALGADNPMSWMWQWYAHFVNGATTKAAELDRVFGTAPSPIRTFAEDTWDMCQPHGGQNANYFLPWHRMFVYYFERVVRYVSGYPAFTLPFWDYTSPDPAKRGIVPPQFRMSGDPVFGSLYIRNRRPYANAGEPIHKDQPGDVMDISDTLAKANYSTSGGITGFCRSVDSGIHSRIHVLVGNGTNMGRIPYAGNDPLFWVHHSNIDRIWTTWTRGGGVNPVTASWTRKKFVMAEAPGNRVQVPLTDYFSETELGYDYESLAQGADARAMAKTSVQGTVPERVAKARSGVTLGARPAQVLLEPLGSVRKSSVLGLDSAPSPKRAYLLLKDLHTWAQPGVLFHVYVGPAHPAAKQDRAHYAGNINFFDAEFHDFGDPSMDMALGENLYSFDVTGILESIRRSNNPHARESLMVTFVPAGTPEGGEPMVGSIELVRQ
jgi:tyrosinase